MKCFLSGRQAAMLVPTTVLAQQHFITAKHRFAKYPVNIAVISRFNTPAQNRNALKKLKSGEIDFIIGTHKLLQKNVEFNNLGLLIVDEEQRFGVAHKERLKEIASETDVLTLTATPIPRTLNMALSGIRDMSILEEAPRNRHPVQTYVVEYNKQVAVDAIRRELSRGGQVYYVHNRVASIDAAASRIARLIPDISIGVAHGQMDELTLSDVMRRMDDGEIQVLVCTTIIETGIDIPNVNTIIIEDADNMGLAQLHQLRGRVGRSSRHAFAYLTYRRGKLLSEIAEKRLSAVREYVEFGSGFKIAMRDLELRGAGNILGAEQSGHMISVGYDMYLRFLEEAVNEERGLDVMHVSDCGVDLNITANIPEEYIASPEQRMDIYRQIASVRSREDAEDIIDELIDRFGEPPKSTLALIDISLLRSGAAAAGITEISQKGGSIRIVMENPDFARISALCAKPEYRGRVLLNAGQQPYLMLRLDKDSPPFDTVSRFVADYKTTSTEE
jgi:transcription-repair coupling factor (superfamily II helicase)